jgi:hypothetical protein
MDDEELRSGRKSAQAMMFGRWQATEDLCPRCGRYGAGWQTSARNTLGHRATSIVCRCRFWTVMRFVTCSSQSRLGWSSRSGSRTAARPSQGTSDVKLVIIDAYQHHFRNGGREAINAAGLSEVCTLVTDRSQLVLPGLVSEGFVADAAFVDGSHIFHNLFVDLYFLRELVRPSGLIIMDDCQWQSVATAVGYFEVNTGWRRQAIDQPTRLRAFRLPDPGVEPSFEEFKPFGSSSST